MLSKTLVRGKLFFVGAFALFLIACGDSATAPVGEKNADGNVADFGPVDNLPSCTENCEGNQAFQPDPCENFQCADKQWNSVEEWPDASGNSATQSFSSSEMPTSGSSVESSSSFAKSSSSNSAKSSSSSVRFSSSSVAKSSSSSVKSSSSQGSSASSSLIEYETLTDTRDGHTYKTVTIGSQVWMAENLNYETKYGSYCYKHDASNCTKYGRLYTWAAAMDTAGIWSDGAGCGYGKTCSPTYPVQGFCPKGWHLPSRADWEELFVMVDGSVTDDSDYDNTVGITAGVKLKSASGWDGSGNGTDAFSFSALPAGRGYYHEVSSPYGYSEWLFGSDYTGRFAGFWSSTEANSTNAYCIYLWDTDDRAFLNHMYGKNYALSVRCLKN